MSTPIHARTAAAWRLGAVASCLALLSAEAGLGNEAAAATLQVAGNLIEERGVGNVPGRRFVYKAESKRLADVLLDFAASQDRPAVVDPQVEGVVTGNFDTTPRAFLNAASKAYGIIWYDDGSTLYFYPSRAIQSRIFRLKGYDPQQVAQMMTELQLGDSRYPLRYDRTNKTLLVYGPPRHVELVGLAIESLDVGAIESDRKVVRVIPLRFASADDRKLGTSVMPGVVTVLRGIFGGPPTSALTAMGPGDSPTAAPNAMKGAKSMRSLFGGDGKYVPDGAGKPGAPGSASPDRAGSVPSPRAIASPLNDIDDAPMFEADEGTNAVIVYARGRVIRQVIELVRSLDVKPVLVELEAMVIDVNSDSVEQLGVNWSVLSGKAQVSMTAPGVPSGNPMMPSSVGSAFSIGTVLRNAGRELIAQVTALQGKGKARVISKPKVLGVANRPSTMQDKRIANVRVAGNLDVNLFKVEAGTLLQVTPQVTMPNGSGPAQIKMSLYIEDGSFEAQLVDAVPIIKRTEIRTEAHVTEGESLLIGGITVESATNAQSGVPGLSRLPLIGGLFRTRTERTSRIERMFLITPRIVGDRALHSEPVSAPAQAAPSQPPALASTAARIVPAVVSATTPALSPHLVDPQPY